MRMQVNYELAQAYRERISAERRADARLDCKQPRGIRKEDS